jgi:phenylpropionate dioxygenase-like ring-hydroxylating dioxygenase large terminal subunit
MTFLRDAWYVAAWAAELKTGSLLARRMLDEPIVLYRDADGSPRALSDRCPHRFAPLSLGRLIGGAVQCPYHGLRFDGSGACVHNPHGPPPKAARVRSFPVAERYSAIWIWMGDPEQADKAAIPDFDFLVPEHWYVGTGHMGIDGPYELEIDNILDLSHIEFLHPLFASEAVSRAELKCSQEGETVWSRRYIRGDTPPAFIYEAFNIPPGTLVDRWLDVRWQAPALMALWAGGVAADQPPKTGVVTPSAHLFTPESVTRTHYFFAISFPRAMGAAGERLARENVALLRQPFEHEDKPIIEAVARSMAGADFWSLNPVLLRGDEAAVRARRILEKRIAAERSGQGAGFRG